MDFEKAISVHANLKTRLATFVGGRSQETFVPALVARDELCIVGQWLHADALVMAGQPDYEALVAVHRRFHLCAAEVVQKVVDGDPRGAIHLLELGPYAEASAQVLTLLRGLAAQLRAADKDRDWVSRAP